MRCDKCKHWNIELGRMNGLVGECTKPKCLWDVTKWDDMENGEYGRVPVKGFEELKMFVQDGSDYTAHLLTKPDFFCAHYEENNYG